MYCTEDGNAQQKFHENGSGRPSVQIAWNGHNTRGHRLKIVKQRMLTCGKFFGQRVVNETNSLTYYVVYVAHRTPTVSKEARQLPEGYEQ